MTHVLVNLATDNSSAQYHKTLMLALAHYICGFAISDRKLALVLSTSNAADRHRIAEAYYEAQRVVAAIEPEKDHARPRIQACLERFKVRKAEDDIAAAGWMLASLQKRIDKHDLADWEAKNRRRW